jgi:hypothetical protein
VLVGADRHHKPTSAGAVRPQALFHTLHLSKPLPLLLRCNATAVHRSSFKAVDRLIHHGTSSFLLGCVVVLLVYSVEWRGWPGPLLTPDATPRLPEVRWACL